MIDEPILTNETLPVKTDVGLPSGISHAFDTGYAVSYGVDEAIMIRNFQFFITANANRGHNFHEGRFWTYDRLEDFLSHFPYWSVQSVRRIIQSLVTQGVLIKGDFNKSWSNRTTWYAFKDQDKFIKHIKPPKTPAPLPPCETSNPENTGNQKKITDLLKSTNDICGNQQMTNVEIDKCIYSTSSIPDAIPSSSSLKVPEEPMPAKAGETELDKSSKPKREKPDYSPKVREVGNQLINSLTRTKPDYVPPKNLTAILTEVDFLLRLDKRDPEKLMDVFNWALADSFWADKMFKPNPAKYLREKFDQLEMKMIAKPSEPKKERKFAPCSNDEKAIQIMEEMSKRAL